MSVFDRSVENLRLDVPLQYISKNGFLLGSNGNFYALFLCNTFVFAQILSRGAKWTYYIIVA